MRAFLQIGWNWKSCGLSILIGEHLKDDLVGYGYDKAPTLTCLEIHILFFGFAIGVLHSFKT